MTPWEINPNITYFTNLKLHNFRSFHIPREIPLAPLTFLLGPNSSGKSSIFDALLLLSQSEYNPSLCAVQKPNWIGNLVDLGSFQDTVYNHDLKLPIEISVGISSPVFRKNKKSIYKQPSILLEYKIGDTSDDQLGRFSSFRLTDLTSKDFIKMDYTKNQVITKIPDKKFINNIKEKKSIENREYLFYREQSSRNHKSDNGMTLNITQNAVYDVKAAWGNRSYGNGLYYTRNLFLNAHESLLIRRVNSFR
jgi:AAA15 family ATPase/GTPase